MGLVFLQFLLFTCCNVSFFFLVFDFLPSILVKIAGYKKELFSHLTGKSKDVVELGVGTGPNFKYYARDSDHNVIGLDPNEKMEKYARSAAIAAGLRPANFTFMRGVLHLIAKNSQLYIMLAIHFAFP